MASRAERTRRAFDLAKIREFYEEKSLITPADFNAMFRDVGQVRALGVDWVLLDHLLSVQREMDLTAHFAALSAGLGRPFRGIEAFLEDLIELELEPPHVLNRTTFYRVPKAPGLLGELLLELGLLDLHVLQRAIGIKMQIGQTVGIDAAIGQVIRALGRLSMVDLFQVLALQTGIRFQSLDASAPAIFAACARRGHL